MFIPTKRLITLFGCLLLSAGSATGAPPGFQSLFNGKDLTGWRGGDTFNHRTLMQMPEDERAAKIAGARG